MSLTLGALTLPPHVRGSIDLTGQVFGRLVVKTKIKAAKAGRSMWLCLCTCGATKLIDTGPLRSGGTVSCGCRRKEIHTELHSRSRGRASKNSLPEDVRKARRTEAYKSAGIKGVEELSSSYIKSGLCAKSGLSASDIPDTLIEAKRTHLQIKRLLNEKRQ